MKKITHFSKFWNRRRRGIATILKASPMHSTIFAASALISAFHFSAAEASKEIKYQEFWEASFLGHEMDVWIEESDDPKTAWFSVKSEEPDTLRVWTQLIQHRMAKMWIMERKFRLSFSKRVASLRMSFMEQKKRSTMFLRA